MKFTVRTLAKQVRRMAELEAENAKLRQIHEQLGIEVSVVDVTRWPIAIRSFNLTPQRIVENDRLRKWWDKQRTRGEPSPVLGSVLDAGDRAIAGEET